MMKFRNILLYLWAIFLFACCDADSSESSAEITARTGKNGYIFTCPKAIKFNVTNEIQFQRFGDLKAGTLKVKFTKHDYHSTNETLVAEKMFYIAQGAPFVSFKVLFKNYNYSYHLGKIHIDGTFDEYHIYGEDTVYYIAPNPKCGIIQIDKPAYKRGETVKARFYMYNNDADSTENVNADIWIERPNGSKMRQWKDEDMQKGVKQYEYNLDDEAVPGTWKIAVVVRGELYADTHFEVSNEELPIFDVTIEKPSYTLVDAKEIPISICAKYFYGNYVKGHVKVNVSFETYDWETQSVPMLVHTQYIDGCLDYKINVSEIDKNGDHNYRRIQISANFTELDTGVKRNKTEFIQRTAMPLNLNFNQDDMYYYHSITQYFKPGLPYNGKLSVTHPDNTPAANEVISVCSSISREKILPRWKAERKVKLCKNYTSDEDGLIQFIIPPQSTDVVAVTLEAGSAKYSSDEMNDYRPHILINPQAYMSLTPWYSPSRSFIQLQSIEKTIFPGSEQRFKLLFTSEEATVYKFHYQVVHQGKVVQIGSVEKAFSLDDDKSSQFSDEGKLLDGVETVLVPQSEKFVTEDPATSEEKFAPFIGELTINLEIDPSWFPTFKLLVYRIQDDKEIVADSKTFKFMICFKDQDENQLVDNVSQPASKTFILENASPYDQCEIKIGEKSFSLFNGTTEEQSFQILRSIGLGSYYHNQEKCKKKVSPQGLRPGASTIHKQIVPSYSPYADSSTAFEKAGFLAISDMDILTRPCSNL